MMHRLYLLRHAEKSSNAADRDIPLSEHGILQSKTLGKWVAKEKISFDLILCSPALRTRQTLDHMVAQADIEAETRFDDTIYNAMSGTNLALIQDIEDRYQSILVIGHNPGIPGLLRYLITEKSLIEKTDWLMRHNYPPCTLSGIDIKTKAWGDIQPASNDLSFILPFGGLDSDKA